MVYCFDLDGTLCTTDGNNYKDSTPKKERIKIVNTLERRQMGFFL
jgi:hydroxymethylpyrimidine pyrophosphatase-like HAD family hydrolase